MSEFKNLKIGTSLKYIGVQESYIDHGSIGRIIRLSEHGFKISNDSSTSNVWNLDMIAENFVLVEEKSVSVVKVETVLMITINDVRTEISLDDAYDLQALLSEEL